MFLETYFSCERVSSHIHIGSQSKVYFLQRFMVKTTFFLFFRYLIRVFLTRILHWFYYIFLGFKIKRNNLIFKYFHIFLLFSFSSLISILVSITACKYFKTLYEGSPFYHHKLIRSNILHLNADPIEYIVL